MVKKRVLNPLPVLDEGLLLEALREEGIKEVSSELRCLCFEQGMECQVSGKTF